MKKLYAELDNKGSYITENWSKTQYEETLTISKDHFLIPLDYIDQNISKRTRLKLLVFQNKDVFNSYLKWISENQINGKRITERFHLFSSHHYISNLFLGLLTPKTEYNYFMGENKNLIVEMMDTIKIVLQSEIDNENYTKLEEIWNLI